MMPMSFILSREWLESSAKANTGDASTSQLARQVPIVLIFEEEDGVLVGSRMMRTCSLSVVEKS